MMGSHHHGLFFINQKQIINKQWYNNLFKFAI